ncbi:hypothetical protein D030_2448A, partial [Vibrio parahaemolyticus AQ3810]
MKRPDFL